MVELSRKLSDRFGGPGAQAFFCNSGAEAIEAAIKYARKATGKPGIVALDGSFHGRTTGAVAITGQAAKREPFAPLLPGVRFAQLNDEESLRAAVGPETGLIVLEPVQGEGGINPLDPGFVALARELADEHGALLCLDEIQTGLGRTGTFFAFEQTDVRPDLVTLAKGLANGLPIGALLVSNAAPRGLRPRRPRLHLRRQPRRERGCLRRRRPDRRRAARTTCGSGASSCAPGWLRFPA